MVLPPWVPNNETKPAPMPLLLVQSFVNTWEGDSGADLLLDPRPARAWLTDARLLESGADLDEEQLSFARGVRESIRALLVHNGGGPAPTPPQLQALTSLARESHLEAEVTAPGRIAFHPTAGGLLESMGEILLVIRDTQRDGTWTRLKACHNDDCQWAFYDRSHAARGAWCDMALCGNRIKNRNLRARRR